MAAAAPDTAIRHALACWAEVCGVTARLIGPLYSLTLAAMAGAVLLEPCVAKLVPTALEQVDSS